MSQEVNKGWRTYAIFGTCIFILFAVLALRGNGIWMAEAQSAEAEVTAYQNYYGDLPQMQKTCDAQQAPTSDFGPTKEVMVSLKAHQLSSPIRVPQGQQVSINSHCQAYEVYWAYPGDSQLQSCGYNQGSFQNRDGKAQWDGVCRPNGEYNLFVRIYQPGTVSLLFMPLPPPQSTSQCCYDSV